MISAHERHESGSLSRHERVFRDPRSGVCDFRAQEHSVGTKFCQRSKSNGWLTPSETGWGQSNSRLTPPESGWAQSKGFLARIKIRGDKKWAQN